MVWREGHPSCTPSSPSIVILLWMAVLKALLPEVPQFPPRPRAMTWSWLNAGPVPAPLVKGDPWQVGFCACEDRAC